MTHDRPSPHARRATAALVVGAAVLLTTSGCALAESLSNDATRHFDTRADAPTEGELAFVLPETIPADAEDITVRVRTDDPDLSMWDWSSESGDLPDHCTPSDPADRPAPFADSSDWPDEATTTAGQLCGVVQVTEVDGHHYAWQA